jgi:hypothetical protein
VASPRINPPPPSPTGRQLRTLPGDVQVREVAEVWMNPGLG